MVDDINLEVAQRIGPTRYEYRGFEIRWTGIKLSIGDCMGCAQWVAYSLHCHVNFYSNTGGGVASFTPGECFDIAGRNHLLGGDTTAEIVERERASHARLIARLDKFIDEREGRA